MNKIILIVLLISIADGLRADVNSLAPRSAWRPKTFSLDLESSYFASSANYSEQGGEYEQLPANGRFSTVQGRAIGHYHALPSLSIFAGPGYGYSDTANDSRNDSQFNLNGYYVGLNHIFYRGKVRALLNIEGFITAKTIDNATTKVLTQDGTHWVHPKIFIFKKLNRFTFTGHLGARLPGDELAKTWSWSFGGEYTVQAFTFGAGLNGSEILQQDARTKNSANRLDLPTRVDSSSYTFQALNPTSMEAQIWTQFRLAKQASLRVGLAKTLNGSNSPEGFSGLLAYRYDLFSTKKDNSNSFEKDPFRPEPTSTTKRATPKKGFEVEDESVPDELFEEDLEYSDDGEPIQSTEKLLEKRIKQENK